MKENKSLTLGTESIGKLFTRMSMPSVVAMVVNGLYYMIDTVFIGRGVGVDALGGLAVIFPIQMLMVAVGAMIGLGTASIVSRRLGEGSVEDARTASGNAVSLSILVGVLLAVSMGFGLQSIVDLMGATPVNAAYAIGYLRVLAPGFAFVFLSFTGVNLVRAEGNAMLAMAGMVLGAVINAVLDPLFIYGFGMGVEGAALATVIARVISTVLYAAYLVRGRNVLRISLRHLRLRLQIVKEIVLMGMGSFLSQFSLSLLALVMNLSLRRYGSDATLAVYGVLGRVLIFVNMPILGLAQGLQPIVGFNYGAGRLDRVRRTLLIAIGSSLAVGGVACVILNGFPKSVLGLFTHSSEMIASGVRPLRITTVLLPLIGVQVMAFSYFQALGKPLAALLTALSREFFILIPLLALLPLVLGLSGVWIAYPVADGLSVVLCLIWMRWQQRRLTEKATAEVGKPALAGRVVD